MMKRESAIRPRKARFSASTITVGLAQLNPKINAPQVNLAKGREAIERAKRAGCDVVQFTECFTVGYPAKDLLRRGDVIRRQREVLGALAECCQGITAMAGYVERNGSGVGKPIHNAAAVLADGRIQSSHHKMLLPTYDVFDEARHFQPANEVLLATVKGRRVAVTICEDIWAEDGFAEKLLYHRNPIEEAVGKGAELIFNLSASPYHLGKEETRDALLTSVARRYGRPIFYCNQVGGNDELIFDGGSLVVDASGEIRGRAKTFAEDLLIAKLHDNGAGGWNVESTLTPWTNDPALRARKALVLGTRDYYEKCGIFKGGVLGLSGGIDSALTAAIGVEALGKDAMLGIALPTRHSSTHSLEDAQVLAANLGMRYEVVDIDPIYRTFRSTLEPFFGGVPEEVTDENLQPRIRMTVLMAFSNRLGLLPLTTGNKSELSVGYCTIYGDMAGALVVPGDVPKGLVYDISRTYPEIPERTIIKPPSAELRLNQFDIDSLPPYDQLDAVLQRLVVDEMSAEEIVEHTGVDRATVDRVIAMVNRSEFKRHQAPVVLRISKRGYGDGRQVPIAQGYGV